MDNLFNVVESNIIVTGAAKIFQLPRFYRRADLDSKSGSSKYEATLNSVIMSDETMKKLILQQL
jgi:hypothetical protein